jgi:hypothetical protein
MSKIRQLIDETTEISGRISFPELVKATTHYEIVKLDPENNPNDRELFMELTNASKNFIDYTNRIHQRFEGNRINEVGKRIEEAFVEELKKTKLKPQLLRKAGYPDMKIMDPAERITFLESKAISEDWDSTFRSFYYTDGSKIDSNARHLLIAWHIKEEKERYWKVFGCKICDLFNLTQIDAKLEFNTNNRMLYRDSMILGHYP